MLRRQQVYGCAGVVVTVDAVVPLGVVNLVGGGFRGLPAVSQILSVWRIVGKQYLLGRRGAGYQPRFGQFG